MGDLLYLQCQHSLQAGEQAASSEMNGALQNRALPLVSVKGYHMSQLCEASHRMHT